MPGSSPITFDSCPAFFRIFRAGCMLGHLRLGQYQADQGLSGLRLDLSLGGKDLQFALFGDQEQRQDLAPILSL